MHGRRLQGGGGRDARSHTLGHARGGVCSSCCGSPGLRSPTDADLIASGAGDKSARLWDLSGPPGEPPKCTVLHQTSKDTTCLEWSPDGQYIATGSDEGIARVWTKAGELVHELPQRKGAIFAVRWNRRGDLLLSGAVDNAVHVYDAKTAAKRQEWRLHTMPVLDVDWRTDTSFASCSTDKSIFVCEVGEEGPRHSFRGHQDEVGGSA